MKILSALLFTTLLASSLTYAKVSDGHSYSHSSGSHATPGVPRDSHGKLARSPTARHQFQRSNACPSTGKKSGSCPGYVIDHVTPLKRGGADSPSNMQWQTTQAAKGKDKWERLPPWE